MAIDEDILDQYKRHLADRYTAEELCELLDLDVWDIIEMFEDKIMVMKEEDDEDE